MRTQTRTRSLLVALAALIAALVIGACGDDDDDDGSDSGGDDSAGGGTIAFLLPETQTARYEALDKPLFEAKVEELCPDCDDRLPERRSGSGQAAAAGRGRDHRGRGRDGPRPGRLDHGGLARRLGRRQADIPVISYDRLILDTDLDYYVAFDSLEVGRQQGERPDREARRGRQRHRADREDQRRPEGQQRHPVQPGLDRGVRCRGRRDRRGVRHSGLAARERAARDGAGDHLGRRGRDQGRLRRERRHRRWRDRRDEGAPASTRRRSRSPARTPS